MKTENNSLLHDLVDPVKNFAEEVHSDTIGDAKRFYSAQAQKMKKNAEAGFSIFTCKLRFCYPPWVQMTRVPP